MKNISRTIQRKANLCFI